jgi:hypothetical protein
MVKDKGVGIEKEYCQVGLCVVLDSGSWYALVKSAINLRFMRGEEFSNQVSEV